MKKLYNISDENIFFLIYQSNKYAIVNNSLRNLYLPNYFIDLSKISIYLINIVTDSNSEFYGKLKGIINHNDLIFENLEKLFLWLYNHKLENKKIFNTFF